MSRASRRAALAAAVADRLTPERTRRPTLFERRTVRRLDEPLLLRLHRWLELTGKVATGVYCVFIASVVLGVDWKDAVQSALNAGKPLRGAIALAVVVPTLLFVAARSLVGFLRWRLQRELWRRDVERLSADVQEHSSA
jgi:hypothetical protein